MSYISARRCRHYDSDMTYRAVVRNADQQKYEHRDRPVRQLRQRTPRDLLVTTSTRRTPDCGTYWFAITQPPEGADASVRPRTVAVLPTKVATADQARDWALRAHPAAPAGSSRLLIYWCHDRGQARLGGGNRGDALSAAAHPSLVWLSFGMRARVTVARRGSRGVCPAQRSAALLAGISRV